MCFGVRIAENTENSLKQSGDCDVVPSEKKQDGIPREKLNALRRKKPRPSFVVGFVDL